jgi:hypothetical protein
VVTSCYLKIKTELSPLAAVAFDDDGAVVGSKRLNATALEYAIDVEHGTLKALSGALSGDNAELQAGWFALLAGEKVQAGIALKVITKCAKVYRHRGLNPAIYFRKVRHDRVLGRSLL